jgi:dihydrofolate reductase
VTVSIVVAATDGEVIGSGGDLPWHLPEDLRHFKRLTLGHVAVMGRVTYQSILERLGHALPGRTSVVVSSHPVPGDGDGVLAAASPRAALDLAGEIAGGGREVFVIGGESIYRQLLPAVDHVHLTRIHRDFPGDRRMPDGWLDGFELTAARPGTSETVPYEFLEYRRARP